MATRTIKTTIAIDGEKKYKQALSEINDALRMHSSNLQRLSSVYRNSANSTEALTAKQKLLKAQIEQQKVKIESLKQAVRESADKFGENSKQANKWQRQLNAAENQLDKLDDELKENEKLLDEANNSADGTAQSIDRFGKSTKTAGNAVNDLAVALASAGVAMGVKRIASALMESVNASKEFESAMAGVYKAVKGTPEQLAAVKSGIQKMALEMPASTTEIAGVVQAAGQLGIATENVLDFSRIMIQMGYTTNMSAEEAATSLARIANITKTSAEDYGRLGSTVFALGNSFATTERDVVEMTNRLAAAGTVAGLTEPEIMALGTAMSSVGIEAQAGGTAMAQTLALVEKSVATGGERLTEFARVSGMSADEFASKWKSAPAQAIQAFITGLGGLSSQGESATMTLDKLGLSGIRQANMLKSLALASDVLGKALTTANSAWDKNTALAEGTAQRFATVESRMKMCGNAANNLKVAIGDTLAPALGKLADSGTSAFAWAAEFVQKHPELVGAITGLITATALLAGGLTAYAAAARIASIVTAQLGAAAMTTMGIVAPLVALFGVIAGLALTSTEEINTTSAAAIKLAKDFKAARIEYENLQNAKAEQSGAGMVEELNKLAAQEEKSAAAKERILYLINELNSKYPELGLAYDEATGKLNKSAMALDDVGSKIAAQSERNAQVARMNKLLDDQAIATRVLSDAKAELAALEAELENYGAVSETAAQQQEQLNGIMGGFEIKTQALIENYNSAYDAAYASISGQISTWQLMPEIVAVSIDDTIASLQSQVEYMNQYAANIAAASKIGISDGLIAQLSDGSQQSAQILAGIVAAGEGKVAELNEAFKKVEEGKQAWSHNMAEIKTHTSEQLAETVSEAEAKIKKLDLNSEAYSAAVSTLEGYISGIKSKSPALASVLAEIGNQVKGGLGGGSGGGFGGWHPKRDGMNYVPFDDFPALLHEGEMVLTKKEATAVREGKVGSGNIVNINARTVDRATIDYIYTKFNADMGAALG